MAGNATLVSAFASSSKVEYPVYHVPRHDILPFISDKYLSIAAPVIAYWLVSLVFELVHRARSPFFEAYRIHEPAEVKSRNKVTRREVFWTVIAQQLVQTLMGILWIEDDPPELGPFRDHAADLDAYERVTRRLAIAALGRGIGSSLAREHGRKLAEWAYWWAVPAVRFALGAFILDGWQYGWHRYFHINTFLYRHIHSWHHRLYVPYAYGALYNHPIEGFVLDTAGAAVAHKLVGFTTREATIFFFVSSAKTVDDHSGFAIPWDPLQFCFANNTDYHDIHHQIAGLKKNFSQPYFIHFDTWFNTRMTRSELESKTRRRKVEGAAAAEPSEVNGPNELAAPPTSERKHKALKTD